MADIDNHMFDHTIDLVVLTKYGGDWVSITLNATPELFASGAAFGSPPEPTEQTMFFYLAKSWNVKAFSFSPEGIYDTLGQDLQHKLVQTEPTIRL